MTTTDLNSPAVTATDPVIADTTAVPSAPDPDNDRTGARVTTVLAALREHLDTDRATNIGFPSTFDFDYTPLFPFFNNLLNNVGDPFTESAFPANTEHLERELVEFFARLLRAPADDYWGYVTTGGTEGTRVDTKEPSEFDLDISLVDAGPAASGYATNTDDDCGSGNTGSDACTGFGS